MYKVKMRPQWIDGIAFRSIMRSCALWRGRSHSGVLWCLLTCMAPVNLTSAGAERTPRLDSEWDWLRESAARTNLSPLHVAACIGDAKEIAGLLQAGADVTAKGTQYAFTPLHWAANGAVVTQLVEAGACLDSTDTVGRTPLFYAAPCRYEVVRALLDLGASAQVSTVFGESPILAVSADGDARTAAALQMRSAPADVMAALLSAIAYDNQPVLQCLRLHAPKDATASVLRPSLMPGAPCVYRGVLEPVYRCAYEDKGRRFVMCFRFDPQDTFYMSYLVRLADSDLKVVRRGTVRCGQFDSPYALVDLSGALAGDRPSLLPGGHVGVAMWPYRRAFVPSRPLMLSTEASEQTARGYNHVRVEPIRWDDAATVHAAVLPTMVWSPTGASARLMGVVAAVAGGTALADGEPQQHGALQPTPLKPLD